MSAVTTALWGRTNVCFGIMRPGPFVRLKGFGEKGHLNFSGGGLGSTLQIFFLISVPYCLVFTFFSSKEFPFKSSFNYLYIVNEV